MGMEAIVWLGARTRVWWKKPTAEEFAAAIEPHLAAMYRLAARLADEGSADDVVQEALLRAWRHRGGFDPRKGTLASWLLAIAANEARRSARPARRLKWSPPTALMAAEDQIDIEAALPHLSPRQRLAIDCHYYIGLSVVETARVMGCSEGTVKSTLSEARARLRSVLEGRT